VTRRGAEIRILVLMLGALLNAVGGAWMTYRGTPGVEIVWVVAGAYCGASFVLWLERRRTVRALEEEIEAVYQRQREQLHDTFGGWRRLE
jgi:hypothetical protein